MSTRLLFLGVFAPLGLLGRPIWRRRVGLGFSPRTASYWRRREARAITADDLRMLR